MSCFTECELIWEDVTVLKDEESDFKGEKLLVICSGVGMAGLGDWVEMAKWLEAIEYLSL